MGSADEVSGLNAKARNALGLVLSPRVVRALIYATSPKFTAGSIVVWVDDHRVLLVRSRYGERRWGFPGGVMSRHEDPVDCAVRELREETGVEVSARELTLVASHTQQHARHIDHVHRLNRPRPSAERWDDTADRFEIAEVGWWPVAALPALRREAAVLFERYADLFSAELND
jgi:ADP-ribose pyrophosphatase YjhB (NUDIX family)